MRLFGPPNLTHTGHGIAIRGDSLLALVKNLHFPFDVLLGIYSSIEGSHPHNTYRILDIALSCPYNPFSSQNGQAHTAVCPQYMSAPQLHKGFLAWREVQAEVLAQGAELKLYI